MNEKEILNKLNFPLLVNLFYSFDDEKYAYLIMSFLEFGDLRRIISQQKKQSEEKTSKSFLF